MTRADTPAGGRPVARRPLAARTTWETIPPRAVVRPGDLLRFSWTPHGWTRPNRVVGMVHCAAQARRTWFVAVDTVTGIPGQWRVQKQADSTLSGEPVWPDDERWWLNNHAECLPLLVNGGEVAGASAQLELFTEPMGIQRCGGQPGVARPTAGRRPHRCTVPDDVQMQGAMCVGRG